MSGTPGAPGTLSRQLVADLQAIAAYAANTGALDMTKGTSVPPLFVQDIRFAVRRFGDQTEIFEKLGIPHPIVSYKMGEAVLDVCFSARPAPFVDTGITDTLRQAPFSNIPDMVFIARHNAQAAGFNISDGSTRTARDTFERDLTEFLARRIQAATGGSGAGSSGGSSGGNPGTPATPGISISVTTVRSSLQILVAPAFFPNIRTVFGNTLSSPVPGTIAPGLYSFGAQGTGVPAQFEPNPFPIPAVTTVNITVV
jgi:hypothetical protein